MSHNGARLDSDNVSSHIHQNPPAEAFQYKLGRAMAAETMAHLVVEPFDFGTATPSLCLVADTDSTVQAYARTEKPDIAVGEHRHPEWGILQKAFVCPRVGGNVFRAPRERDADYVMIKRLNKRIVHRFMELGGDENPYKEAARMQEFGDNIHVLECTEFLEDDEYLYIVTPCGCADGTLKDAISWFDSEKVMEPRRCRRIFEKILKILMYLEKCGINHHDLSPDNLLFLTPDNLVVFDLALSLRLPIDPSTGRRTLISPPGSFGKAAWMAAEVFTNQPYDGAAMDLWAAGVILYNLLTNHLLYEQPSRTDLSYYYFVYSRGLSSVPLNERTIDLLSNLRERAQTGDAKSADMQQWLFDKATAHLNISPEAIELLENMLHHDPEHRFSLQQVVESQYVSIRED